MTLRSIALGPEGFAVETFTQDGVTVLTVSGEVDIATAPQLDERLSQAPEMPLVVDLCQCDFMDSSGLMVLLKHRARQHGFAIACIPKGAPAQLFTVTGFDPDGNGTSMLLPIFPTRSDAVDALARNLLRTA